MATETLRQLLAPVLHRYRETIGTVYLFGSSLEEHPPPDADVDLAVLLKKGAKSSAGEVRLALHADLCRALHRNDIDLVILDMVSNLSLLDDIIRWGRILYDDDPEAREYFEVRTLHAAIDFKTQRQQVMGI